MQSEFETKRRLENEQVTRLADLSPLLEVLDPQNLLRELRDYYGTGKVDKAPSLYHDESIQLGLRFNFWDTQPHGRIDDTDFGKRSVYLYTSAEKKEESLVILARRNPTVAFRVLPWGSSESWTKWIQFSLDQKDIARQQLEDSTYSSISKLPTPNSLIKEASSRVIRDVPFYRIPLGFLFQPR